MMLEEAGKLSKVQFAEKFPHPFLLCETNKPATIPSAFGGRLEIASPMTIMATTPGKRPTAAPDQSAVRSRPESFVLFPVTKSDRNPWAERILVGRAKNNDVVLHNQSVSKVQAYFSKGPTRLQLFTFQTLNPTQLNGKIVAANTPGIDVPDGAEVQFGAVVCRFFESASLHGMLLGR
jgi:hypothetical protein